MSSLVEVVFWISVALVFHSYVVFPMVLKGITVLQKRRPTKIDGSANPDSQKLSILIAAYNEEAVIEEKIESILHSSTLQTYEILVGSDCSSDRTNEILERLEKEHPKLIRFFPFKKRQGKPRIINQLVSYSSGDLLILSDANVMFHKDTINELCRPFQDEEIGLVDSQMINKGARSSGISIQEKAYITREVGIKYAEGVIWGAMMGPFGGCFAMRKNLYQSVPDNFLVDDFFLNMIVLENGYQAINNPNAVVFEDVSNDLWIEYRRKIRIATGNFQNLNRFKKMLWPPWTGIAFSFFSHKVIRWFGPLLYLIALSSAGFLAFSETFYRLIFLALLGLIFAPLLDLLLKKLSIHISFLRFITHFCAMNLAMLVGLVRYKKGVKNNVWQPTKRNQ